MGVFSSADRNGHTQVLFGADDATGLRAIIAIHSTELGPALGGTRFFPYETEADALKDVLRLSRGMTLKNAAAGLDHGGGKGVIIGDPATLKSEGLLRAYGRLVDSLNGRFVTAEDVGTTAEDMEWVCRETKWAAGMSSVNGGSGDPSPATALGLFSAVQATAEYVFGSGDLAGRRVAVQGVGKVGYHYVGHLVEAGAEVLVSDVWQPAVDRVVEELGVKQVPTADILSSDVDILSPCAMGGVFHAESIGRLNCTVIAGSANNQLATDAEADRIAARGIVFAPDFVVNAGGVINVEDELHGYRLDRATAHVKDVGRRTLAVLEAAEARSVTPNQAAVDMAMGRIAAISQLRTR